MGHYTSEAMIGRPLALAYLLFAIFCLSLSGCSAPAWYIGVGGKYNEAKTEVARPQGANLDKAILNLEGIVTQNPTYRDSLTLLGGAYYKKSRYQDAFQILQRALAVNKDDEIAWILLGLSQLRLGDDQRGLDSIKGGITLLSRAMQDEYRGFSGWDRNGIVRTALRRATFSATKGLEEKDNIFRSGEALLQRINDEEWYQQHSDRVIKRREENIAY